MRVAPSLCCHSRVSSSVIIARRREVARHQSRLAGWDYESARLEVLTDVTQRYITVLAAHRRIEVAREAMQLAQQVQSTTKKRIDAGDAPPIEAARATLIVSPCRRSDASASAPLRGR